MHIVFHTNFISDEFDDVEYRSQGEDVKVGVEEHSQVVVHVGCDQRGGSSKL